MAKSKVESVDVEEIFVEPDKVISLLKAGFIIDLLDENGHAFGRVEPIEKSRKRARKTLGKSKMKPHS